MAADVVIRDATPADIADLLADMRAIDRLEVALMATEATLHGAVESTVEGSLFCKAARVDGDLVAIWGVVARDLYGDDACPWMLTTNAVASRAVRRAVLRFARAELDEAAEGWGRLWNLVHEDNRAALRFCKWLGFSVGRSYSFGGARFRMIERQVTRHVH